jgi:UDP-N-acetylmuramate--alanine ligase
MVENVKHVHFVGIGGINMSALAKWFLHEGVKVTGSDMAKSNLTQQVETAGAQVTQGHSESNMTDSIDLVVYSPAVPETNPERAWAVANNVRCLSNFELLGEISKDFSTIVVTGTNGKSTTTAMLGLILEAAGYDPTVLVGTLVPGFKDGNLRIGKGRFFVVEGCEYKANMLHMDPEMVVLTNIEEDHLDFYRDLDHIKETFQQFIDKLQGKGLAIWNQDNENARSLNYPKGVSTGIETEAEYHGHDRTAGEGQQSMQVNRDEGSRVELGELTLQVPGTFNLSNALQATAAAMELGVPFETCRRALADFTGVWRRFERLGTWNGADVISDYGHHPTGVKETIEGAKEFFPGRRVVLCYQPHQHDRTRKLFDGFVETLPLADELIVVEIYDVAGRNEDHNISSSELVNAINQNGNNAQFAPDFETAKQQLTDLVQEKDVLIIMGAGDIDDLARDLV